MSQHDDNTQGIQGLTQASEARVCPCIPKRAVIHTLGCRLNQAETRIIADQLRRAGYEILPFGQEADLGIIHTCVVTREAEAKSRKLIRRFARENPGAPIVVIGCYAQTAFPKIAAMDGVRLILGTDAKMNLAEYLSVLESDNEQVVCNRVKPALFKVPFLEDGEPISRRVNLKIQDGCDAMCTYCYIPFARGRSRSRYFEDAVTEAAALVRRGAREIVLTGVNLGDFKDGDRGLTALVDAIDALTPKPRIRISSIELNTIPEGLLSRMADPDHGLASHLHVPLQSGADNVLKAMGRPYTAREYFDFIEGAAAAVSGIGLGADVMVGFPGETDEDFETTCENINQSPLNYLHVFQYSERRQVASSRLPGKVSVQIMQERSEILRRIGREKHEDFMKRWIGCDLEVLFESRRGENWAGHTGNYLEVLVVYTSDLINKCRYVHIEAVDGIYLKGNVCI